MPSIHSVSRMAKPSSKKSGKGSKQNRKQADSKATSKAGGVSGGSQPESGAPENGPQIREGVDPQTALSMSEAAKLVGVAARTLQRRAAEGRLPVVLEQRGQRAIWRVLPADLAAAYPDRSESILNRGSRAADPTSPPQQEQAPKAAGNSRRDPASGSKHQETSRAQDRGQTSPPSAAKGAGSERAHGAPGSNSAEPSESQTDSAWVGELLASKDALQADIDRHREDRHGLERELAVTQTRLESARSQVVRLESQVQSIEHSHHSELDSQDERHRQAILALREALEVAREELSASKATPLSLEGPDTDQIERRSRRQIAGAVAAVALGLGGPLLWAALELGTVRAAQKELRTERDSLAAQTHKDQGELAARQSELNLLRGDLEAEAAQREQQMSELSATQARVELLGDELERTRSQERQVVGERDAAREQALVEQAQRELWEGTAVERAEALAQTELELTQLSGRLSDSEEQRTDLAVRVQIESERAEFRESEVQRLRLELEAWQSERREMLDQLRDLREELDQEQGSGASETVGPEAANPEAANPDSATPGPPGTDQAAPDQPATDQALPESTEADSAPGESGTDPEIVGSPSSMEAWGPLAWRRLGGLWMVVPEPADMGFEAGL